MPSENRRPKDDTWTSAELNKALKGSKDDSHRSKKPKEDSSERRHHREELTSSDHRKDDGRRSNKKDEDEKKSKRHRDRGDSVEKVELTEEDRERLRQERRLKRVGGGTEEKKPRAKESKPEKVVDEDEGRKRRHKEDDGRMERRLDREDESQKHKKDRERERRQYEMEKEKARQAEGEKEYRRHKTDDGNGEKKRRHKEEGSSRRHEESDRRNKSKDESDRHRTKDMEENEEERERRRQERRERQEREKLKEKSKDKDREGNKEKRRESDRDIEKHREKDTDRVKERDKHKDRDKEREKSKESQRKSKSLEKEEEPKHKKKEKLEDLDSKKTSSRRQELHCGPSHRPVGWHTMWLNEKEKEKKKLVKEESEEDEDDYNYEEDFEAYEDDFEDDNEEDNDEDQDDDVPSRKRGGEMEEVLRALDEENNRVASSTSRRSNWSESTDHSDDHGRDSKNDYDSVTKASKPKAFINFMSAKQRVINRTGKAWKRYEDLSKLIELDVSKFDMFDLPPVKEYELYIRSFGRSDTKQAYVQTRDDDIDRDVQTEEVENLSKWTQHPSDNEIAVGGEGINVQTAADSDTASGPTDPERLNQFLNKVGQFLFTILDEESKSSSRDEKKKEHKSKVSFSKKAFHLGASGFLKGHSVVALSFCQSEPNFVLSVHASHYDITQVNEETPSVTPHQSATQSFICVWNISQPTYPYRICVNDMKITSACFSPTRATLVFAGMFDGSVALWDLRESGSQHKNMMIDEQEHLVRFPTYNTARVLESENHCSPVVAIISVYSHLVGSQKDESITESKSGLSFQLASIDETAVVNLWVIAEIAVPDAAGSENDLGLAPGGRIKLLRSSTITITNPKKFLSLSQELKALDLRINPADLKHFYVATDAGCVVHGVRFGNRAYPQYYSSLVDSPVPIVSIDFSPFGQPYFLAACQDGTVHLFHTKIDKPISTWRNFISGETILTVRWSQSRPSVFFVLDSSSAVFTFDLVENGLAPVKMDRITLAKIKCLEVGGDPNLMTVGVSRPAYMVCASETGEIEAFTLTDEMRQQQPLEEEFLARYVDRY